MAIIRGQSYVVRYIAWDTSTSPWTRKTGDASNHTVYVDIDDGASSAITVTITEIDSTNRPGEYKFTLSGTYTNGNSIGVSIKSSTANVWIQPMTLLTETGRLDVTVGSRAAPGAAMSLTTATIDAIWEYNEADIATGIGNRIKTNLDAPVSAVKAQTDKMSFTGANINADVKMMSTNVTVGSYATGLSPAEQVLAVPANKLSTDTSGRVTVGTNADKSGYALATGEHTNIAAAVWNTIMEGSFTAIKYMRLFASALFGKVSGAETNNVVFRDTGDTKNRITMQVDDSGNRLSVMLDGN